MAKNKVLFIISERISEYLQNLNISVYLLTLKDQNFDFENWFESIYKEIITYSLEYLPYKDIDKYKPIYYKYFSEVNKFSIENGIMFLKYAISNKQIYFKYWTENRLNFLQEIIDINKIETC